MLQFILFIIHPYINGFCISYISCPIGQKCFLPKGAALISISDSQGYLLSIFGSLSLQRQSIWYPSKVHFFSNFKLNSPRRVPKLEPGTFQGRVTRITLNFWYWQAEYETSPPLLPSPQSRHDCDIYIHRRCEIWE